MHVVAGEEPTGGGSVVLMTLLAVTVEDVLLHHTRRLNARIHYKLVEVKCRSPVGSRLQKPRCNEVSSPMLDCSNRSSVTRFIIMLYFVSVL